MFIRTLDADRRIDQPSWDAVEAAIRSLDGRDLDEAYLVREQAVTYMGIGGGTGRYVVTAAFDLGGPNERIVVASEEARGDGVEELVAGGQLGNYPARQVVSLQTALAAAEAFYSDGTLTTAVRWEAT